VTGLTHEFLKEWDRWLIYAIKALPEVFRWIFHLGRNGTDDPISTKTLTQNYPISYMLYCLRYVGLSQQNSIDVNTYFLIMDLIFDIPMSLDLMSRGDGLATTLQSYITIEGATRKILFVSDDNDLASFYSPILGSTVCSLSDLYCRVDKCDVESIREKMINMGVLNKPLVYKRRIVITPGKVPKRRRGDLIVNKKQRAKRFIEGLLRETPPEPEHALSVPESQPSSLNPSVPLEQNDGVSQEEADMVTSWEDMLVDIARGDRI